MRCRPLKHLADCSLLNDLTTIVSQDLTTTVRMLTYIAEVCVRKLYAQAGYPSMYKYCVHELHMSEDVAYKRVKAALAGLRFHEIHDAIADGRLHLTAVSLLEPHLSPDTLESLLSAATHKTTAQVRVLIAERFPKPDLPTLVRAIVGPAAGDRLGLSSAVPSIASDSASQKEPLVSKPVDLSNAASSTASTVPVVSPVLPRAAVAPSSPGRFTLQLTMSQETHDLLREAQALLGHIVPSGDVEAVLKRALREMVKQLRKQKCAETAQPRTERGGSSTTSARQIPAAVRRTVWKRDGGRCTFVSDTGRRCDERARVEYDHVVPLSRGGSSTTNNLRLRCRTHNQYTAECVFGSEFIKAKREQARRVTTPAASGPA
jgi:hypothetical protein